MVRETQVGCSTSFEMSCENTAKLNHVAGRKKYRQKNAQGITINQVGVEIAQKNVGMRFQENVLYTIFRYFGCQPDIDAFGSGQQHQCPVWWGPGGVCEDAFSQSWGEGKFLWINPAPEILEKVVEKIALDKAWVMLVCPRWANRHYWWEVQPMVVDWIDFLSGAPIFRSDKKNIIEGKMGGQRFIVGWEVTASGNFEKNSGTTGKVDPGFCRVYERFYGPIPLLAGVKVKFACTR